MFRLPPQLPQHLENREKQEGGLPSQSRRQRQEVDCSKKATQNNSELIDSDETEIRETAESIDKPKRGGIAQPDGEGELSIMWIHIYLRIAITTLLRPTEPKVRCASCLKNSGCLLGFLLGAAKNKKGLITETSVPDTGLLTSRYELSSWR